jgi:hypothetical protein
MISIAKLLNGKQTPVPEAPSESNPPSENSPVRFLQPLLHGVARSVVETDPDQLAGFLETFDRIEHELENAASSSEILTKVSEAVLAVEEYNRRASVASQSYRNELHNILFSFDGDCQFFRKFQRSWRRKPFFD